ncbi:MAG: NAD(P)H-hydrate epimerase [Anaerolineales bacterium]|nr:MAG: NAD(P)H-hydrate epimerase [Anaerolineales bacterium]
MDRIFFQTDKGVRIPAVDEAEMREVDRIAVEQYRLGILQMMENAGRNVALHAMQWLDDPTARITILVGPGGNGGGGLCCARHLHNHGHPVELFLSREPAALHGATKTQMTILESAGLLPGALEHSEDGLSSSELIIDALIGYSLGGAPTGQIEKLINLANAASIPILSLDLPSGVNASTGETPGAHIHAARTLTLALPKAGLRNVAGSIYLVDIGIPPELFLSLGVEVPTLPSGVSIQRLHPAGSPPI